jgi:exodeoxyribonuclease III
VKIATYNAAGIRARMPRLLEWLGENQPDVLAIQETKVIDELFPRNEFEEMGYHVAAHGQKSFNGVAILSKFEITDVENGVRDEQFANEARTISASINDVRVINTYVPNGNTVGSEKWSYKMAWLERFRGFLNESCSKDQPLIWLGDINIAPQPHDVYNSEKLLGGVGHHPEEFERLANIVDYGLVDVFRLHEFAGGHYSFWDFREIASVSRGLGWRIDHIYANESLAEKCRSCVIDVAARKLEKPSDHTFVVAEFDI